MTYKILSLSPAKIVSNKSGAERFLAMHSEVLFLNESVFLNESFDQAIQ